MKSQKKLKKGKQAQKLDRQNKPMRYHPQDIVEDMPIRKSPDVNRVVDNIFQKYNDFAIMDRD